MVNHKSQHHNKQEQSNRNQSVANETIQKKSNSLEASPFEDNRPEVLAQSQWQQIANNSPQVQNAAAIQRMADSYTSSINPIQRQENNTGLPDNLKSGIESLSGYSMNDVQVHYNSDKPAQLQAHAYAQGTDIHVAPGKEATLPHEAWHVVQQKQGRVKATTQLKGKINVNDETSLEKEADVMGAKSLQVNKQNEPVVQNKLNYSQSSSEGIVQGIFFNNTKYTFADSDSSDLDALYELLVTTYGLNHDEDGRHAQAFWEIMKSEDHENTVYNTPQELVSAINLKSLTIHIPGIDDVGTQGVQDISLAPKRKKKKKNKRKKVQKGASKAITAASTITGFGSDMMIDKITGQNVKAGLPLTLKRKVEIKIGQFFNVLGGTSEAIIPIVGGALAAPFDAIGGTLEAHGQGMNKKQAAAQGGLKASSAAAIGAIPVWGHVHGVTSLLESGKALFGKLKSPSKMEAIRHLREVRATLDQMIEQVGEDVAYSDPEFVKMDRLVNKYLTKYESLVSDKVQQGTGSLLKYQDF